MSIFSPPTSDVLWYLFLIILSFDLYEGITSSKASSYTITVASDFIATGWEVCKEIWEFASFGRLTCFIYSLNILYVLQLFPSSISYYL